jgi:hypothetical protein
VGSASGPAVSSQTYLGLDSGVAQQSDIFLIDESTWGSGSLVMVVDSLDQVEECDETDNILNLGAWPCEE